MSRTGRPLALLGALALLVSAFLPWAGNGRTGIDLGLLTFGDRLAQPTVGLVLVALAAVPAVAALLHDHGWPRGLTGLAAGALVVVWLAEGPDGAIVPGVAAAMVAVGLLVAAAAVATPSRARTARYPGAPDGPAGAQTPPTPTAPAQQRWWHGATGYEIYIRSFADGDGDGVGDLAGIASRLDHLVDLGIDFVWITPFYPSPGHDHGYDVADYRDIDPQFGTLEQFDALLGQAHARGLKLLVDLVPNHTSHEHEWFQRSRSSRQDPYRDFYVWRDPAPGGGPPNNWVSHFGGPAWTLDEATGQYYLHLFLPEQPDLDWTNPAVRDQFDGILRFWLDRGVDGFRVDVAHALTYDPELRDNPLVGDPPPPGAGPRETFVAYDHRHDLDQPDNVEIFRRWRAIAEEYDAVLLGEVFLRDLERVRRYIADQDGLHLALYIELAFTWWDHELQHRVLRDGVEVDGSGRGLAYPVGSHDDPRAATRMGGGQLGADRALACTTLLAGLPGTLVLYQGDELGLADVEIPPDRYADPIAARNPGTAPFTRDAVRTPMPWSPHGAMLGFTTADDAWLPMGDRRPDQTAEVQRADPASPLRRHRDLLAAKAHLPDLTGNAEVHWL
ncbi:MAG TPA: alpha-amylase family glycosyl hydrolase, partial [Nitriliruptorales bacterium]